MALVAHAAAEARRLGLRLWLYDESDYPSGTAGGRAAPLYSLNPV